MNKKGLSILLALSMVFSLNTFAFAEEATTEEATVEAVTEEAVEVEAEDDVKTQSEQSKTDYDNTDYSSQVSCDGVSMNGTSLTVDSTTGGVTNYTGGKLTAARLGLTLNDTDTGYGIAVKSIKLTGSNKKANAVGKVTFNIKSIGGIKDVYGYNPTTGGSYAVTLADAKDALKALKTKFKTAKSQELSAYIRPTFVSGAVSKDALTALKKLKSSISIDDLDNYGINIDITAGNRPANNSAVYIQAKNGTVKKVQLVYFEYKDLTPKTNGLVYTLKMKTKTLKKGTDYTVSGDSAVFKDSTTFTAAGPIKAT